MIVCKKMESEGRKKGVCKENESERETNREDKYEQAERQPGRQIWRLVQQEAQMCTTE